MYKVLIIDDEVLVRVGLKTTIDWEAIGFTVVAEASNGEQGYEQYKKHLPDVVITDIKMPKKDGLWLVEKIRKENKDVKILVLTCYDEFSFVRKALKAEADDYILKSEVEDEELITVMKSIKEKIDEIKKVGSHFTTLKTNKNDIKSSLFSDIIETDFILDNKMKDRCKEAELKIGDSKYAFATIMINGKSHSEMSETESLQQINDAIKNIIFDQLEDRNIDYVFTNHIKKFTFLFSADKLDSNELKRLFDSLDHATEQYFDISLSVIYTKAFDDFELALENYTIFMEKSQVLFYNTEDAFFLATCQDIDFEDANIFELKKQYNKIFNELIGQEKEEDAVRLIKEVTSYFKKRRVNPKMVKIFYSNLIGDIFNDYGQLFELNQEIQHHEYYHYKVINSENLNTIVDLMQDFVIKVIAEIKQSRYHQSKYIINTAVNIIENNYDKKISLEDVANELHLSKHYLCSIFKKETGYNMSFYINKLRIEKAKNLLLSQDCKIKEIFEEVGYSNQQYFSKVFKKMTGMTVSEYKENMGQ